MFCAHALMASFSDFGKDHAPMRLSFADGGKGRVTVIADCGRPFI
jgi:hypothetical protein